MSRVRETLARLAPARREVLDRALSYLPEDLDPRCCEVSLRVLPGAVPAELRVVFYRQDEEAARTWPLFAGGFESFHRLIEPLVPAGSARLFREVVARHPGDPRDSALGLQLSAAAHVVKVYRWIRDLEPGARLARVEEACRVFGYDARASCRADARLLTAYGIALASGGASAVRFYERTIDFRPADFARRGLPGGEEALRRYEDLARVLGSAPRDVYTGWRPSREGDLSVKLEPMVNRDFEVGELVRLVERLGVSAASLSERLGPLSDRGRVHLVVLSLEGEGLCLYLLLP